MLLHYFLILVMVSLPLTMLTWYDDWINQLYIHSLPKTFSVMRLLLNWGTSQQSFHTLGMFWIKK